MLVLRNVRYITNLSSCMHAKNGKILPFEVEQKVEIKGGAEISTELESFSLICNILRIKKT